MIDWQKKHKTIQLYEEQMSYIDTVEGDDTLLLLHGFASTSFDFRKIIDELKTSYRVIVPDLIGFGLSSKPKNYFSVVDQASTLTIFLKALSITKINVITHGFGTYIIEEILSIISLGKTNLRINSIFFLNTSLQLQPLQDELKQDKTKNSILSMLLKLTMSYPIFKKYLNESFYNKKTLSEEEFETSWNLLNYNHGMHTFHFGDNYLLETKRFHDKKFKNLKKLKAKKILIWGNNDELDKNKATNASENLLNIDKNNMFLLEKCGHYPALEQPEKVIEIIQKNITTVQTSNR